MAPGSPKQAQLCLGAVTADRCANSWCPADGATGGRGARRDLHHPAANEVCGSKALPHQLRGSFRRGVMGGHMQVSMEDNHQHSFPMENKL